MAVAQPTAGKVARPSRLQTLWKNISIVFESRIATVGMALVLFWVVLGFISLFWTPYPPNATEFQQNLPPNSTNWLGTDQLGRDILSRLMVGTQVILLKTRVPEFGLGSYMIFFAGLVGLVSVVTFFMVWARMFSRFLWLFMGVLAITGLILVAYVITLLFPFLFFPGIGAISNVLIRVVGFIFLGIMLFAFIWGWINAKRLKMTRPYR